MSIPKPLTQSLSEAILSVMGSNGRVKESEEDINEVSPHNEEYSPENPKIDLHNKVTGEYLASTNWSPNIKHAVAGYEEKNPKMKGFVKGFKSK